MSDSLWPHELQHTRPPCPSPTPGVYPNSCPLSQWCHLTISSSVIPFSSCLQSFPTSGSFQMSQVFLPGGQNIGVSASISVLPMNTQDWSPLGWSGWISLQTKGLSRVFSNTREALKYSLRNLKLDSITQLFKIFQRCHLREKSEILTLSYKVLQHSLHDWVPWYPTDLIFWYFSPAGSLQPYWCLGASVNVKQYLIPGPWYWMSLCLGHFSLISFSSAPLLSCVRLFATPWNADHCLQISVKISLYKWIFPFLVNRVVFPVLPAVRVKL